MDLNEITEAVTGRTVTGVRWGRESLADPGEYVVLIFDDGSTLYADEPTYYSPESEAFHREEQ